MRIPVIHWVLLAVLLIALASPASALVTKKMQVQASFNPTLSDKGVSILISGRVFEPSNISIPNAVMSIQVNNPQGTSIHVAIAYTNQGGIFQDSFLLAPNSPGGNYTAFVAADKPGYDTARLTLTFAYATPDFTIEGSMNTLSLEQGQTGSLTVTVLSLRGFNQPVNLTAIDPPAGVVIQFSPASITPSGTATAIVTVSETAQVGNYTITLLGVSGSLGRKTSFQLNLSQGPIQANLMFLILGAGFIILLVGAGLALSLRGRRRRREAVLEEILKHASADSGYVATARVIARLEELRAMGKVDEATYQRLRKEYEKRLEKSK